MTVVFQQVCIPLIFVAIGYILAKAKVVNTEHSKILSGVLVYVFLPCNAFSIFSSNFSPAYLTANYPMLLVSLVVMVVIIVGSYFCAKLLSRHSYEQRIYEYSLTIPNFGYMGTALAEGLLGNAGLTDFMVFSLPANLHIYTLGFARLTKRSLSLKGLLNPAIFATVLGVLTGLFQIRLPAIAIEVVSKARSCLGPVSMLMAGIVMAEFDIKSILGNWKIYPVVALRLLIIPGIFGLMLMPLGNPDIVRIAVLFLALPCGMNTVVFPKLVGENCRIGAGLAMVSTVLSSLTIPLLFVLFGIQL